MKVNLLLFASIRDAAGCGEITLDIEGSTVGDALQALYDKHPAVEKHAAQMHIAVNEEYARPDTPLNDGDTLALIPPVSGGSV